MLTKKPLKSLPKYSVFISIFIVCCTTVRSQEVFKCDDLTPSGDKRYAYDSLGESFCEGFYVEKSSSSTIDLVSFTQGKVTFELSENDNIIVRKAKGIQKDLNVRAVAIPLNTNYRMDSRLVGKNELFWDMSRCLAPNLLSQDRIGIYGWLSGVRQRSFYPISLNDVSQDDDLYYLKFRSTVEIEDFRIQILSVNELKTGDNEQRVRYGRIRPGTGIEFQLNKYLEKYTEVSRAVILIKAKVREGNWLDPVEYLLVLKDK